MFWIDGKALATLGRISALPALLAIGGIGHAGQAVDGSRRAPQLPSLISFATGPVTFTIPFNVTFTYTEWPSAALPYYRVIADLSGARSARFVYTVTVGSVGEIVVQYSLDSGSTWAALGTILGSDGPSGTLILGGPNTRASDRVPLVTAARADVMLRLAVADGDGSTAATIYNPYVEFSAQ